MFLYIIITSGKDLILSFKDVATSERNITITTNQQSSSVLHTFMQCTPSQGLKLCKVVHQVAVLVLGVRGHVVELPDVTLPDAQSEDLDTTFPQSCRHWTRVAAIRVAVGDQENDLGGISTGVTEDLLLEKKTKSLS